MGPVSVSLDRARKSIGRRVRHTEKHFEGVVERVGEYDVWVKEHDGNVSACDPANLEWVSTLSERLMDGIRYGSDRFDDVQVRHTADLYTDDPDNEQLHGLGIVYSGGGANDDDENHPLYVVAHAIKRVWPVRYNADPFGALEIEERMGWAEA